MTNINSTYLQLIRYIHLQDGISLFTSITNKMFLKLIKKKTKLNNHSFYLYNKTSSVKVSFYLESFYVIICIEKTQHQQQNFILASLLLFIVAVDAALEWNDMDETYQLFYTSETF